MDDTMTTCLQPTSSVLFDGCVPTLTGLDGDMWASQLLTINTIKSLTIFIFDFTDTPRYVGIQRVEVVMFNCPQRGIAFTTIDLLGATARGQLFSRLGFISVSSLTSCKYLVRVCLSATVSQPLIGLQFILDQDSDWVHLAEVTFYPRGSTCPPNVICNQTTTPPPDTKPSNTMSPTIPTTLLDAITSDNILASSGESSQNTTTSMEFFGISTQDKMTTTIIAVVVPLFIVPIIIIIVVVLILCIVYTTKHKYRLRTKEDHTTTHRQTHNHQPPQDRGHINLCEETGQAYYSSIHDIQGEDVPADQVYNRLERDTGPVRGGAKSSRGATVDQNKAEMGAYSTVSYIKQPQVSKEAGMNDPLSQLYAQVDEDVKKKKSEDIFATDQQEEASASALYAQMDEKRKKKKKKIEEDTPPHEPDQLYAQVDKKKRKKREKEEIEEVSPQELGDVYSVVNKPSAPPVPLKSDLLMEELQ